MIDTALWDFDTVGSSYDLLQLYLLIFVDVNENTSYGNVRYGIAAIWEETRKYVYNG